MRRGIEVLGVELLQALPHFTHHRHHKGARSADPLVVADIAWGGEAEKLTEDVVQHDRLSSHKMKCYSFTTASFTNLLPEPCWFCLPWLAAINLHRFYHLYVPVVLQILSLLAPVRRVWQSNKGRVSGLIWSCDDGWKIWYTGCIKCNITSTIYYMTAVGACSPWVAPTTIEYMRDAGWNACKTRNKTWHCENVQGFGRQLKTQPRLRWQEWREWKNADANSFREGWSRKRSTSLHYLAVPPALTGRPADSMRGPESESKGRTKINNVLDVVCDRESEAGAK